MPEILYDPVTTPAVAGTVAPNARGVQYSTAIGQGMEEVGQQGSRLASDMNRLNYQQKEADGVASLQKNISDGYQDFTKFSEEQKNQMGPTGVSPDGTGYADVVTKHINDWSDQLVGQQTTPRLKRMAAEQARSMGDHFFSQASAWQVATNRAYRVDSFDQGIQTDSATIDRDPSMYQTLLKQREDSIDALSAQLHPDDKVTLKNKARSQYAEAASLSWARSHPQDTVNAILPQTQASTDSIPQKIVAAARAKGVDANSALAIAQFESGLKPDAQNPSSSANGLFQMIKTTGDQYFEPGADRGNADNQITAGVNFIADNQKAFKSLTGRDPTTPELYSAHLLGFSGAANLAKAPATQPFAELAQQMYGANAPAVVANNGFAGLTVGQVRDKIGGWMNQSLIKTAGLAKQPTSGEDAATAATDKQALPWLDALTPQGRQAILTHAQNQVKKDDAGMEALATQQVTSTVAAYQRGESVPNPPTFDSLVKSGMPAIKASMTMQTVNDWQQFGANYAKVKTASPDEQTALLAQSRPQPGTADYSVRAEGYDALQRAVQYVNQQRSADPVRYDQEAGLQTTKPIDWQQPDAFTVQMHNRYVGADQVAKNSGTPYQAFSKQEAQQLGGYLQQATPQDAMQKLLLMANSADSPEHYHAALSQIAPDHPNMAVAGQLALHNPQAAALVIAGDRLLKDKDRIPLPSVTAFAKQFDTDRGAAYAGLPDTANADMQAVIAHYVASQPAGQRNDKTIDPDLWKKSLDAVAPSTSYNGRQTLVPAGSDPSRFADTISARWGQALQGAGLDPAAYPAGAYQLASAGADGVYVPYNGTLPLMANGRRVVIDLNEPQATAAVTPQNPAEAQPRNLKGRRLTTADLVTDKRFR